MKFSQKTCILIRGNAGLFKATINLKHALQGLAFLKSYEGVCVCLSVRFNKKQSIHFLQGDMFIQLLHLVRKQNLISFIATTRFQLQAKEQKGETDSLVRHCVNV